MLTFTAALVGLLLGARHALEPDHLAAVTALSGEKRGIGARLLLGASWGVGHSLTLLLVGGGLALFEAKMPERLGQGLELLVGLMILALGARALRRAFLEGRAGDAHLHAHGGYTHAHPAPPAHLHLSRWTLATRPLLVGMVHGLAGSGALTAMVLVELHGTWNRLGYILLFGLGSVVGMGLLTALAGWPLERLGARRRWAAGLTAATGALAVGLGGWWAVRSAAGLWGV